MSAKLSVVLLCVFGLCCAAEAALAIDLRDSGNEFADKTVVVFLEKPMRVPSLVLTNAGLKDIGGRIFLAGTGAYTKRERDPALGKKVRVAWADVTSYMLLTKAEYEQYIKESDQK